MDDSQSHDDDQSEKDKTIFINLRGGQQPQPPPEEETRFFRQKYKPPFVTFVGSGGRVASSLTPLQDIALAYAFPAFRGRAIINSAGAAEPEWAQAARESPAYDENVERQLQGRKSLRRRYSGDSHQILPREKYFALYAGGRRRPSYTLLGEMNAYAVPLKTGCCAAVPLAEPGAIGVIFRGLPGEPNPLYHFVNEPERYDYLFAEVPRDPRSRISPELAAIVLPDTQFIVAVPYENVQLSIEHVFDLRLPEARRWMVEFFRNPPPVETDDDLAHGGWLQFMAEDYEFDLSKVDGWRALLPVVCDPNFGGNGMGDMFACFLRRLGCGGLIYPSARCDHGVVIEEGRLVDHWGWNLVSYTGSPIPTRLSPEDATPLRPLEGIYHFAEIESGAQAGSFVSLGNSLHTKLDNQVLFDHYAVIHGSEWRLKHKRPSMPVRGYWWYRRAYSLRREDGEMVACDRCDARFSFEQVSIMALCPICQFGGDLGFFETVPQFFIPHMKEV